MRKLLGRGVRFIMRHRVKIFDAGFIAIVLLVAALFAFEVDIFRHEGSLTQAQETLELDELMICVTLLMGGVLFYTWRRAHEHRRENDRRLAAEREVMNLALHDPLTGLPNRRQFDTALRTALNALPAAPEAHAVFLLDLNGFKKINDVHGHPVGDQALIHVGARLLRSVRDGDLVARLGGDEFAILARNVAGAEAATTIALRIIDSLQTPVSAGGVNHAVGTAIGVALSPSDGVDAQELLRKADVALYRAKAERKSTVRFFEAQMDARLHERDALERALRAAVDADRITVRFQPCGRIDENRIAGFEATAHWEDEQLGVVEPERFLAVAEEAGLLAALTERTLAKACAAAATWPKTVRLSMNLPSGLLPDQTFGLRVLKTLADMELAPNRLDLEVDEGALIRDIEAARLLLAPLRKAGVSIVADHFGTGYADLKNLHKLQLDRIKIDPSYIQAMTRDRQAAVMVKALIGIGQGLGLSVIADGVVGEDQRAALAAQGCEEHQGALYGGAVDAAQASAMLAATPKRRRA